MGEGGDGDGEDGGKVVRRRGDDPYVDTMVRIISLVCPPVRGPVRGRLWYTRIDRLVASLKFWRVAANQSTP